ncbi:shikimate transporter [Vibrio ponticus]|nr:shikimate transporter [Vibrio ponticus]
MHNNNVKKAGPVSESELRRIVTGSFAGALLEWYDFFIFGTAASIIFGPIFFPSDEPIFGIMASFATFGVGFLARPLGGVVFGHYGDKVGRKVTLMWTLSIVGASTFLIGLIPSYDSIGIWAPVLLVVLRLIQGFGLGGEYGGAALISIEAAPEHRRGFIGSLPQVAASAGIMLATGVFWVLHQVFTEQQMLDWGWRIPFLLSAVMALVGMYIRAHSVETLHLCEDEEHPDDAKPVVALFKHHRRNIFLAFGARLAETVSSNTVNAFAISYVAIQLAMGQELPLQAMIIASGVGICICPIVGWLSDRYGQRTMYKLGAGFLVFAMVPYFYLLQSGDAVLITLA